MDRRSFFQATALLSSVPFVGGLIPSPPSPFKLTPLEQVKFVSSVQFKYDNLLVGEVELHRELANFTVFIQFPEQLNNIEHMLRAVELYADFKYQRIYTHGWIPSVSWVHAYDPRVGKIFHSGSEWHELSSLYDHRPIVG